MSIAEVSSVEFDDRYARELPELAVVAEAESVRAPEMVALNRQLADDLGIEADALETPEGVALLTGALAADGPEPVALAYAGHQFGGYSPQLGDGRAVLLGELIDVEGVRRDLHLKGSGRTPFARGGDGKAALGPMLREFLFAEAMHELGVPTGRALAVLTTGEKIARERLAEGAILARVASSHIRVGTFQYAAARDGASRNDGAEGDVVKRLADHAIARHYPEAASAPNPYLALLEAVAEAQAELVAKWMLIGFIHGVLNTDNVLISGETIDYGPCAFMDRYAAGTVFSSIDHGGRYAFGNQPGITQWNLARFAETLLPLIDADDDAAVEAATAVLHSYGEHYERHWQAGFAAKLGFADTAPDDGAFFEEFLQLLETHRIDYTSSFRALADAARGDDAPWLALADDDAALAEWLGSWRDRLSARGVTPAAAAAEMDQINPIYIPRNHLVEEALEAAESGDLAPFGELLDIVTDPFGRGHDRSELKRFSEPASDDFTATFRTFCGT